MPALRTVCVYAGSYPGADPRYAEAAEALAWEIGRRGLGIVYGGGSVGPMGVLADAALAAGAPVTGVIPRALDAREIAHGGLTELRRGRDHARAQGADGGPRRRLRRPPRRRRHDRGADRGPHLDAAPASTTSRWASSTPGATGGRCEPCSTGRSRPSSSALGHRAMLLSDEDPAALLDALAAWEPPGLPKFGEAPRI